MSDTGDTTVCNLAELSKTAPTRRELAWELLKQTRNPEYVSMRYEFPLEQMRAALEKIPDAKPTTLTKRAELLGNVSAATRPEFFSRPGALLPEVISRERIPGEDDDKE